jgi:hypothetical protein
MVAAVGANDQSTIAFRDAMPVVTPGILRLLSSSSAKCRSASQRS